MIIDTDNSTKSDREKGHNSRVSIVVFNFILLPCVILQGLFHTLNTMILKYGFLSMVLQRKENP